MREQNNYKSQMLRFTFKTDVTVRFLSSLAIVPGKTSVVQVLLVFSLVTIALEW